MWFRSRAPAGWACALLAGAAGGMAAATLDFVRLLPELPRYLPGSGGGRLWAFLLSLYGCMLALGGLLLGLLLSLLAAVTVLGPLLVLDRRFRDGEEAVKERTTGPLWALAVSALLAAAGLGGAMYGPALFCLLRFHHSTLIALLVGAAAAGLLWPLSAAGLLLFAGLSAAVRPRRPLSLQGPLSLYAVGGALATLTLGGTVCLTLLSLQHNLRMNAPLRALNLALWTPALALGAVALGYLVGRSLAALLRRSPQALRLVALPEAGCLLVVLVLAVPTAGLLLGYWHTMRLLDLRPITTLACGAVVGLAVFFMLSRQGVRRTWAWGLLLPLSWALALGLGHSDRVRKAALSQAPLAGPLLFGMQQVFDLDRDGFPSRWVIGGTDCDDLDPSIHPGAFDWPDDGIDQNCNGHQATLPTAQIAPWPSRPPGLPERPNVLLITIDALRADHVSSYGYGRPTTPVLDGLSATGFLFRNAWAHAPSTRYSVPAILTGLYPSTIDWGPPSQHWPPEVLPDNRLLSEMLKARGYHTIALLSYHYFEPTWGLARGFDDYDVHLMTLHSMGGDPAATSGTSARELADLTAGRLMEQARHPETPFFLWVHFYDPHYRYEVHPGIQFGTGREEEDLYDGEVRYTDQHIGRVLDALRSTGQWDRTLIIVTADHGEGFGEHGIPKDHRHGYHLYANQTKVPLLMKVPGLPGAPKIVEAPVGHVDLVPTILNLCGGTAAEQPQLPGRSLLGLLLGGADPDGRVFQEVMYEGPTVRKAVATLRWHYIRNEIPDGTSELYDLQRDPKEDHDLQGDPAVAGAERELSQALASWMDESALPRDFAEKVRGNLSDRPLPAGTPLSATLGGWLEVTGADVRTPEVRRGGTAEIAVVLHGLRRVPQGWHLFMHLSSPGGPFLNADHEPLMGLLPLQQIRPGQYVRDVVRVPVPANWARGPLTLEVGLYQGGKRAQVAGPGAAVSRQQNVVRAATVVVQ